MTNLNNYEKNYVKELEQLVLEAYERIEVLENRGERKEEIEGFIRIIGNLEYCIRIVYHNSNKRFRIKQDKQLDQVRYNIGGYNKNGKE